MSIVPEHRHIGFTVGMARREYRYGGLVVIQIFFSCFDASVHLFVGTFFTVCFGTVMLVSLCVSLPVNHSF